MNTPLHKKKIMVFDVDGVILDSIGLVRNDLKKRHPAMTEDEFKDVFLGNFWEGIEKFKEKYGAGESTEKSKEERARARARARDAIKAFEGMKEVLERASKKHILVINSSGRREHIEAPLRRLGLLRFFNFVASREVSNDKAEKFALILGRYEASPEDVVFVTDTIGDVLDSDRAGIDSIAVAWGVHDRADFEGREFKHLLSVVDTTDDLLSLFEPSTQ